MTNKLYTSIIYLSFPAFAFTNIYQAKFVMNERHFLNKLWQEYFLIPDNLTQDCRVRRQDRSFGKQFALFIVSAFRVSYRQCSLDFMLNTKFERTFRVREKNNNSIDQIKRVGATFAIK